MLSYDYTNNQRPRSPGRKKLAYILVIALLIFAALLGYRIYGKIAAGGRKGAPSAYAVGTAVLKYQNIDRVLSFQGILEGDPQVKIYPPVNGKFAGNAVAEGTFVKAGQIIAYINRDIIGSDYLPAPVTSPISGVVIKLYFMDNGAYVATSAPVAEVANPAALKAVLNAGEKDLLNIRRGMPVKIYPAGDPSAVTASVSSVTPYIDRETLSGSVVVRTNNGGGKLKIGMSVGADISIGTIRGFFVPEPAIVSGLDRVYVFLVRGGKAAEVPVTTGYSRNGMVEIKGNFKEGDIVVTQGAFKLYEGVAVKTEQ